jgi:hypothetical protein
MAKASKVAAAEAEALKRERLENYNKVVAAAELGAIQLVKLDFDVSPEYFVESDENQLGYVITPESSEYDPDAGIAVCAIEFQVNAMRGEAPVLQCNATYTIMYSISETCDVHAVKAFIERVGVFSCYPYFRGVFANLDWAANTRLPPLPIHKEEVKRKANPRRKNTKALQSQEE